jgi:N4-(beta-N-acetylglucosaminyl)-L-asparaginase
MSNNQFSRRTFLQSSLAALTFPHTALANEPTGNLAEHFASSTPATPPTSTKPVILTTWDPNVPANKAATAVLERGGRALDAVEQGVRVTEADPKDTSVGYGGMPDREGKVTLDASIMDEFGNCGSVLALEHIMHPVSVARRVMEKTQHVMLAGDGALAFALKEGFKRENLLTSYAKSEWKNWLKEQSRKPEDRKKQLEPPHIDKSNHDTIGMLALDTHGNLSGACSTSGWAFKLHGRVGDSPIIGAGLYVDNEVGAATSSGLGELVVKAVGSFLVTEFMRNGKTPQQACELAIERIARKQSDYKELQVGFLALGKNGDIGAFSLTKGFTYALYRNGVHTTHEAASFVA